MCMMVYLSAAAPLRTVPWVEEAPAFYVASLDPEEESVRKQFRDQHVVFAGSHEGCGCGFQLGEDEGAGLDEMALEGRRESLRALSTYLREELASRGSIELFACWDGDQAAPPEHRRTLTPSLLELGPFSFFQKELSTIQRDAE